MAQKREHRTPESIIAEFLSYAPQRRYKWEEDPDELDRIENVDVSCGCYRLALVPHYENFIIKIGFNDEGDKMNKRELELYQEAEKQNLHRFFAAPRTIICAGDWSWYVFDKVELVGYQERFPRQCTYRDKKFFNWLYDQGMRFEPAYNYLSNASGQRLVGFFTKYHLRDFHYGNFGYSKRLRHIVFTDYAGY